MQKNLNKITLLQQKKMPLIIYIVLDEEFIDLFSLYNKKHSKIKR
jgi:hypothetical protein